MPYTGYLRGSPRADDVLRALVYDGDNESGSCLHTEHSQAQRWLGRKPEEHEIKTSLMKNVSVQCGKKVPLKNR